LTFILCKLSFGLGKPVNLIGWCTMAGRSRISVEKKKSKVGSAGKSPLYHMNRALELTGELEIVIGKQQGNQNQETFLTSSIIVNYETDLGHGTEMVHLTPEATEELMKILSYQGSAIVKSLFEGTKEDARKALEQG